MPSDTAMTTTPIPGSGPRFAAAPDRATLMREVTHDLKNPLGAAAGYAELLADGMGGQLTAKQLDMVLHIRQLIRVSLERVSELLDLVRTESGGIPLVIENLDMCRLVCEVISDYQGEARQKEIALDVEVPTEPLFAWSNAAAVRRIVGNLLSNALKYTPAQGRVSVVLRHLPPERSAACGNVAIDVRDTGPGIQLEQRERIFDLFVRVPTAGGETLGDGIGLSASRRLARLLGGDVTVANREKGGAEFSLRLPRCPQTQEHASTGGRSDTASAVVADASAERRPDALRSTDRQGRAAVSEIAIDEALRMTFPASDPVAL